MTKKEENNERSRIWRNYEYMFWDLIILIPPPNNVILNTFLSNDSSPQGAFQCHVINNKW